MHNKSVIVKHIMKNLSEARFDVVFHRNGTRHSRTQSLDFIRQIKMPAAQEPKTGRSIGNG
jgi:hypothetical protein